MSRGATGYWSALGRAGIKHLGTQVMQQSAFISAINLALPVKFSGVRESIHVIQQDFQQVGVKGVTHQMQAGVLASTLGLCRFVAAVKGLQNTSDSAPAHQLNLLDSSTRGFVFQVTMQCTATAYQELLLAGAVCHDLRHDTVTSTVSVLKSVWVALAVCHPWRGPDQ